MIHQGLVQRKVLPIVKLIPGLPTMVQVATPHTADLCIRKTGMMRKEFPQG